MTLANQAFARRWMDEIWNERREETIEEMMAPDAVGHVESGTVVGYEPFKQYRAALLNAFPDLRITVEDAVSREDAVVIRWRVNGTHLGDGLGIAASGKPVSFGGMTWFRLENGRAVEGWDSWNMGGLLASLSPAAND
jgi:steroid delta-isomerase-like uncharacterized protein